MPYKFERLDVWQLALGYTDLAYTVGDLLPRSEQFNLRSQLVRAATGIALNIAEGSTGQTDAEQARFLGYAIRSLIETVACMHLIHRRGYLTDAGPLREAYRASERLFAGLQAFRKSMTASDSVREEAEWYTVEGECPF
jgi:four helix bundle protein